MKRAIFVLCIFLAGCTAVRQTEAPTEQAEVISMVPLPPLTSVSSAQGLTLNVLFHVRNDGTVLDARMLGSSGDSEWDSLAARSMRQWRFALLGSDTTAGDRWFRERVVVQVQEPVVMNLGELVCPSPQEADSVYALLEKGVDFDTLAKQVRGITSTEYCRCPGAVEIARFPRHVRDKLMKLGMNDITHPLRLGANYVIYKRFPGHISSSVPE